MTTHSTRTITRRHALRLAGALAALGAAAVGGPALAQQAPGTPGMGGMPGMDHGGTMGDVPGGMTCGQPSGMPGGMSGMVQGVQS